MQTQTRPQPWDGLFAGAPESRALASGRDYRGPVVDGCWMRGYDYRLPDPGLPVLSVNAATEGSFFTGPGSPVPLQLPTNDTELHEAVRRYLLKGTTEVARLSGTPEAARLRAWDDAAWVPAPS
ncbi:hypothetical protein [Kitasatospora sp. GP82]|uniref:hypothetical protein n=1 Tax=Kitasatospora sp. GP82 TaxID=3035089 RepID=UPI00247583D4|nr:hypothetical protein [Kitasatospora sp. GP82]